MMLYLTMSCARRGESFFYANNRVMQGRIITPEAILNIIFFYKRNGEDLTFSFFQRIEGQIILTIIMKQKSKMPSNPNAKKSIHCRVNTRRQVFLFKAV